MKNRVLILAENDRFTKELMKMIYEIDNRIKIFLFYEINHAVKYMVENKITLFIVDLAFVYNKQYENAGLHFARRIRVMEEYYITPIIFISMNKNLKIEISQSISFVSYYKYPFEKDKLQIILSKIFMSNKEEKKIILKSRGVTFSVKVDDIVYGEVYRRVFRLMTKHQVFYIPYLSMSEFISSVKDYSIYQCQRSFVVNIAYVAYIDEIRKKVFLKESFGEIELGYSYKKNILEAFKKES